MERESGKREMEGESERVERKRGERVCVRERERETESVGQRT